MKIDQKLIKTNTIKIIFLKYFLEAQYILTNGNEKAKE